MERDNGGYYVSSKKSTGSVLIFSCRINDWVTRRYTYLYWCSNFISMKNKGLFASKNRKKAS